jgi:S1-C subfamily serine protease
MKKVLAALTAIAAVIIAVAVHTEMERNRYRSVIALTEPTAVMLVVGKDKKFVGGSGVVISPNGHVLTCAHLFIMGNQITATLKGGITVPADLIAYDVSKDLALIKLRGDLRGMPYASFRQDPVEQGDEVVAIGAPLGLSFTATRGHRLLR